MRRMIQTVLIGFVLSGCSTVMEASRPAAVNLKRITIGEKRIDVVSQFGAPATNLKDGQRSCDVYKLFTHGVSNVGKGAIVVGEAAADFFTLGLAEVLTTSGEAATKSHPHTVVVCYSGEDQLVSMQDNGAFVLGNPQLSVASQASATTAEVAPAAAPVATPPQPLTTPTVLQKH